MLGFVLALSLLSRAVIAADVEVETVLNGLHRPTAAVVRPGGTADRYELFIAESGSGRVVRWANLTPDSVKPSIEGFSAGDGSHPARQRGPLTLLFIDAGLLAVGGAFDEGQGLVRVFELPDEDAAPAADKPREQLNGGPNDTSCSALTRTRVNEYVQDQLILSVRGKSGNSLRKARIQAGTFGELQPLAGAAALASSQALTTSPTGRIVVVENAANAEAGEITFYSPIDGTVELTMPLDLPDVVALAYSPTTNNLYVADFERGFHRIDDASSPGRPACRVTKIADVPRPTALAFAPDGTLYLTTFGEKSNDGSLRVLTESL